MLRLAFMFVIGAVVGVGATLVIANLQDADAGPQTAAGAAAPADTPLRTPKVPMEVDPYASDADLAEVLTLAEFDRNWETVGEVAEALREREPSPGVSPGEDDPATPAGPNSLAELEHSYRDRIAEIELSSRDNPATRLVQSGRSAEQITQGLKELFLAPQLTEADRRVRRDAALLLARQPDPLARRILLDALEQTDLVQVAAFALARAGDPDANAILIAILRDDQDPARRALAARALTRTRSLAEGAAAASALAKAARGDVDLGVRTHAIAALAQADLTRSAEARRALVDMLSDPAQPLDVRRAVIATLDAQLALAHRLPTPVVEGLETLASSEHGMLRREVIALLGEAGRARTVELFEGMLPTLGAEDRAAVRAALERLERRIVPE